MTPQKHFPVDLSPLWQYPDSMFVVRYLDMNEAVRRKFAWCIKRWAPQRKLRVNIIGAPTIEDIQSVLAEINPILLSSRQADRPGADNRLQRSPFGFGIKMSSWAHKKLTQIIYSRLCTKEKRMWITDLLSLISTHTEVADDIEESLQHQFEVSSLANTQQENLIAQPEDITMQKLQDINQNHSSQRHHDLPPFQYEGGPIRRITGISH